MTASIIAAIDKQIASLQQAREILAGKDPAVATATSAKKRGRPVGSKSTSVPTTVTAPKRTMSAETRARMAAAQKQRHANKKKTAKPVAKVTE